MSKPQLDSDLYGGLFPLLSALSAPLTRPDIYGDEEPTATPVPTPAPAPASQSPSKASGAFGLPPKPSPQTSSTPSSNSLSYSAQIAQQFSSYQQTPSQERQQVMKRAAPPVQQMIPPSTPTEDGIFGKKPSEMHDAG